jgi:hypothetical protein
MRDDRYTVLPDIVRNITLLNPFHGRRDDEGDQRQQTGNLVEQHGAKERLLSER